MAKSRIAIVGLGLIGGSIGLGIKKAKLDVEVVGHDKDTGVAARAVKRGAVDKTEWNLFNACQGAGLIVLALPLNEIKATLGFLKEGLQPGVIVTDTATTKAPVLEWAQELPSDVYFVGGNPVLKPTRVVSGRGIDAADASLFEGATYCITSMPQTPNNAIETIISFATMLGARAYFIDAAEHDGLMTGVEHLPVLLAAALSAATMCSQGWRELGALAGNDFRVMTELVPEDAKTAREQFLAHRGDLVRWVDEVAGRLDELREMLEREDAAAIEGLVRLIGDERAKWLSGKLTDPLMPETNVRGMGFSAGHLLFGGLADRKPRK